MTYKFDSLYKDAVGANNYDLNDPIVGFINNLKVLNADPIGEINASSAAITTTTTSSRDRKKTYSSINSSDFDSSLSSMSGPSSHLSEGASVNTPYDDFDEEDEDEYEDEDTYDEEEEDDEEYEEDQGVVLDDHNINKKFKRN